MARARHRGPGWVCGLGAALVGAVLPLRAWQTQPAKVPTITTTAGEVLFDMVVAGRHNRLVKNLRPSDVEILDNGVPQQLISFRLISHGAPVHLAAGKALGGKEAGFLSLAPSVAAVQDVNLVALVFGSMDMAGAAEARRGAISFITSDLGPDDYVAVYRVGVGAFLMQDFTVDRAALVRAVNQATRPFARRFPAIMPGNLGAASVPPSSAAGNGTGGSDRAGSALAALSTAQGEFENRSDTTAAARITLEPLLTMVHNLDRFPGRKTVLFFNQWLPVDLATIHVLKAAIADSNRGKVAFYTIDPELAQTTENGEMASRLQNAAGISQQEARSDAFGAAVTTTQANLSDITEGIQYTSRGRMEDLADSTGGRFISNTNDLGPQLREVADEMDAHYEVSWRPSSGWDGKYHAIQVKLRRRGLAVRARPGYEASPVTARAAALNQPVPAYEAPVLALFDRQPPPAALPLRQAGFIFPADPHDQKVEVLLSVPIADLACERQAAGGETCPFVVLALIKDRQGAIAGKWSQNIALNLPAGRQPRAFLFERTAALPPGIYHLQGAVYQAKARKGAVRKTLLYVPPGSGLRLSSIVVLAGNIPLDANLPERMTGDPNPLHYAGLRLIPALGQPLPTGERKITLFFIVYPPPGNSAAMTIVFSRGGIAVARASEPLPPPDANGQIIMTPAFDFKDIPSGDYQVDVRVSAGGRTVTQAGHFVLAR
ncbi:MAG: VWA domain-containing protein [Terriglobales bacterium]